MVQMSSQMVAQFRKECSQGAKARRTYEQGHVDGLKRITIQYLIHQKVCMQLRFKYTHTCKHAFMHACTHTHARTHAHTYTHISCFATLFWLGSGLLLCRYVKTVSTVVIWGGGGGGGTVVLKKCGKIKTNWIILIILIVKLSKVCTKRLMPSFHCPWYLKISSDSEMFNCDKA